MAGIHHIYKGTVVWTTYADAASGKTYEKCFIIVDGKRRERPCSIEDMAVLHSFITRQIKKGVPQFVEAQANEADIRKRAAKVRDVWREIEGWVRLAKIVAPQIIPPELAAHYCRPQ